MAGADPYKSLGVSPAASDAELRSAYRALVKRHHPDHNGGSAESAARFAEIQAAYNAILRRRSLAVASAKPIQDPKVEERIREMEREIARTPNKQVRQAQESALQAAARQKAAYDATARGRRPTPEELGQYSTEDSFTMIVDDAFEQVSERLRSSEAKRQFARRLTDLFNGEE